MKKLTRLLAVLLFAALPAFAQPVQYAPKPCKMDGTDCSPKTMTLTGPILLGNGTVGVPSYSFSAEPNTGFFRSGAGKINVSVLGAYVGEYGFSGSTAYFLIPADNSAFILGIGADLALSRRGAASLSLGYADAAAPVAQTLSVQGARGGTDTNTAAVTTTIQGSLGTGTGATGDIVFKTGTPQTTGTAQHVAATALTLHNAGTAGVAEPRILASVGAGTATATVSGTYAKFVSAAGVGNGADTTDDALWTLTPIPANTFTANGDALILTLSMNFGATGNNKRIGVTVGGTQISTGTNNGSGTDIPAWIYIARVDATHVNVQITAPGILGAHSYNLVVANLTTNTLAVVVTGASPTTGAANDVVLYIGVAEFKK